MTAIIVGRLQQLDIRRPAVALGTLIVPVTVLTVLSQPLASIEMASESSNVGGDRLAIPALYSAGLLAASAGLSLAEHPAVHDPRERRWWRVSAAALSRDVRARITVGRN